MMRWYREPRRVKPMDSLDRAGFGFVPGSSGFSKSDLVNLYNRAQKDKRVAS